MSWMHMVAAVNEVLEQIRSVLNLSHPSQLKNSLPPSTTTLYVMLVTKTFASYEEIDTDFQKS